MRKALKTQRRRNTSSAVDPKYGRWIPKNRYNVDQVPLPFVNEQSKTYDTLGAKQVWVSQPASGLGRQATLQLCIRADGKQNVKPALIFRGKEHVSTEEKEKYDKKVDVYFQQNAWMDEDTNMKWVQGTLIPGVGQNDQAEKVLFADNVGFQQSEQFHEIARKEINTTIYMLPENHTDKIQPIDAGCGRIIKLKIGTAMETWLEKDNNLDKWHNGLSAKERRILLTQWTGEAWSELNKNQTFFRRLFEKTGCLLTADGSDDFKVSPQGLSDYHF